MPQGKNRPVFLNPEWNAGRIKPDETRESEPSSVTEQDRRLPNPSPN